MQMYMKLDYNPSTDTAEMLPNLICKMYLDIVDKQNRILGPTQWANENSFFFFMLPKLEFNDEHFLQMSGVPMG